VSGEPSVPEVTVTTKPREREETRTRQLPPYNVVLENDHYHTMEFVVNVLRKVLGCTVDRAFEFMLQAHNSGRSIVWTGPKEVAELKVEQIRTFHEVHPVDGANLGPLGCYIEPAPAG
jgi:ATP-dependent Clp protease adaptor protein ClpS